MLVKPRMYYIDTVELLVDATIDYKGSYIRHLNRNKRHDKMQTLPDELGAISVLISPMSAHNVDCHHAQVLSDIGFIFSFPNINVKQLDI